MEKLFFGQLKQDHKVYIQTLCSLLSFAFFHSQRMSLQPKSTQRMCGGHLFNGQPSVRPPLFWLKDPWPSL